MTISLAAAGEALEVGRIVSPAAIVVPLCLLGSVIGARIRTRVRARWSARRPRRVA